MVTPTCSNIQGINCEGFVETIKPVIDLGFFAIICLAIVMILTGGIFIIGADKESKGRTLIVGGISTLLLSTGLFYGLINYFFN